ncbi:MAG: helix-turn-helix domain-containing protein [Pseudomonadota bacterium]
MEKSSLEDITLSWRARGLLSYLLSRPDNWDIIINNLIKQSPDGRTTIRSSLKELEASGYLRRERVNGEKGG